MFNPSNFLGSLHRYSHSEKHKFIWFFSRLFVPLTWRSKVLPLGSTKRKRCFSLEFHSLNRTFDLSTCRSKVLTFENPKRNLVFLFGFCSLNRTFNPSVFRYFRSEVQKEKGVFLLYFSHLFVPLTWRSKVLTFENPKRNLVFLFGFCSLNRTFVCEIY